MAGREPYTMSYGRKRLSDFVFLCILVPLRLFFWTIAKVL